MGKSVRMAFAAAAVLAVAEAARAQDEPPQIDARVNYVYASQFGFGGYSVGGLSVQVYSLPISFLLEDVVGDWDLKVGLPIIYGRYDVSGESQGLEVSADQNTIGFEPRLRLDIPIFEGFRLSPLGALGVVFPFAGEARIRYRGERFDFDIDDEPFYTYQIGLSSLYEKPLGDFTLSLGNAFIYAGDAPFDRQLGSVIEGYGTFRSGVDVRHPLGFRIGDLVPDASLFFIYSVFTPALKFTRIGDDELSVPQIFEVGFTVGSKTPLVLPVLGGLLDGMRIGAGYDRGSDFEAIHVVFGFPF